MLVVALALFCALGTWVSLVGCVTAIGAADVLWVVFWGSSTMVFGLMMFALPLFWRVRRRKLPPIARVVTPGGAALFVPAPRRTQLPALAFLVGGSLWMACYVFLGMTVWEPDAELHHLWNYLVLLLALAICVFGGYAAWTTARALRHRHGLLLAPDGIAVEAGYAQQTTGWDDIGSIWPRADNNNYQVIVVSHRLTTVRRTRLVRSRGHTAREIRLNAATYRIDPALLFHLICHYRVHPEHRHELSTGDAVARIRRGGLSSTADRA
ncbi:hypothetical protein ACFVVM_34040 [Nocardia sp. NPDC058176]|uniref:hypothetical protein n=1 Tax=Nocardia sp. NPDC058176 TaxID=3346368 RepID=UPI0036DD1045